jgi:protein transport protein SEC61 subunit gamma and related proteins
MGDRSFLDRAWDLQHRIEKKFNAIGKGRYARVLRMARKPSPEEFRNTAKIVLVGIAVVGGIAFVIFLFMEWFLRVIGAQ